jgi:hypothetical protein
MTNELKQAVPSGLALRDELEQLVLKELLGPGFHEPKQGIRYTIRELARREVLACLLNLTHERDTEEVARGLHGKKKGQGSRGQGRGMKKAKEKCR